MSAPPRPIVEADLHAFVDGQMDFDRRASFMQAMALDPELRAKVDQWRRQNEALMASFGGVLREPLPLRLMPTTLIREKALPGAVREAPRAPSPTEAGTPFGRSARATAMMVAAFVAGAALVYIAETLSSGPVTPPGQRIPDAVTASGTRGLALRAYEAHRTYATDLNHAVEIPASDGQRLVNWIQHRLSMAIRLPDLQHEGWTLIGGRILPGEVGPAAFLIYGNGVDRLGLYIARTNAHQSDALAIYDNGAGLGSVGYWVDEPVGYALTTNRDATWLDRNGAALFRSVKVQAKDNSASD